MYIHISIDLDVHKYSREISGAVDGSLNPVRTGLRNGDSVGSLNLEVVPAVVLHHAVVPQDGDHFLGGVTRLRSSILVLRSSCGYGGQESEDHLKHPSYDQRRHWF